MFGRRYDAARAEWLAAWVPLSEIENAMVAEAGFFGRWVAAYAASGKSAR
jgi:hypothetical protein